MIQHLQGSFRNVCIAVFVLLVVAGAGLIVVDLSPGLGWGLIVIALAVASASRGLIAPTRSDARPRRAARPHTSTGPQPGRVSRRVDQHHRRT